MRVGCGAEFFDFGDGAEGFIDVIDRGLSSKLLDDVAVEEERDGLAERGGVGGTIRVESVAGGVHGVGHPGSELVVVDKVLEAPEAGITDLHAEALGRREGDAPVNFRDGIVGKPFDELVSVFWRELREK